MTLYVQNLPSLPLSCPLHSHPYTFKPLTNDTLSEFLTLIYPISRSNSSPVISLDFLVASHLFSFTRCSFYLPPRDEASAPRVGNRRSPNLPFPPSLYPTSWHPVPTYSLITVRLGLSPSLMSLIHLNSVCCRVQQPLRMCFMSQTRDGMIARA